MAEFVGIYIFRFLGVFRRGLVGSRTWFRFFIGYFEMLGFCCA